MYIATVKADEKLIIRFKKYLKKYGKLFSYELKRVLDEALRDEIGRYEEGENDKKNTN